MIQATLLNGAFGDPVLWVRSPSRPRAILCDCGSIDRLRPGELFRVGLLLLSHAHLDHIADFPRLLRARLAHDVPLRVVGPRGMGDRIAALLGGYSWNLLGDDSPDFIVTVDEFDSGRLRVRTLFRQRNGFRRETGEAPRLAAGLVADDDRMKIEAVEFDHGIPSIGYALQTPDRLSFDGTEAARRGLHAGPWIEKMKRAIGAGAPDNDRVDGEPGTIGALRDLFSVRAGERIVYVTDVADTPGNRTRILALAAGADHLFMEAAFADEDVGQAQSRHHLTAGLSGALARQAGVKALTPMHLSARYADDPERVLRQVEAAFGTPVTR